MTLDGMLNNITHGAGTLQFQQYQKRSRIEKAFERLLLQNHAKSYLFHVEILKDFQRMKACG